MTRTININSLPLEVRRGAYSTTVEHAKAQKIAPQSRTTFRLFSNAETVAVDALISAIVDGMHADVTRSGTSATRRRQVDPLLALYRVIQRTQAADAFENFAEPIRAAVAAEPVETTAQRQQRLAGEETAALLRYARSIMTSDQRVALAHFGNGWQEGAAR